MLAQKLDQIQNSSGFTLKFKDFGELISLVLQKYVFYAAGIALLVYLVTGGLQMMLSRGDPKAVQAAQGKITNALLGFVIIFASYWITQILGDMLGIGIFKDIFK